MVVVRILASPNLGRLCCALCASCTCCRVKIVPLPIIAIIKQSLWTTFLGLGGSNLCGLWTSPCSHDTHTVISENRKRQMSSFSFCGGLLHTASPGIVLHTTTAAHWTLVLPSMTAAHWTLVLPFVGTFIKYSTKFFSLALQCSHFVLKIINIGRCWA